MVIKSKELQEAKRVLYLELLKIGINEYDEVELEILYQLSKDKQIHELFDKQKKQNIKWK